MTVFVSDSNIFCFYVCMHKFQLPKAFPAEDALLDAALGALASLAANQRKHQVGERTNG